MAVTNGDRIDTIIALEEKCETLIERAIAVGADADFNAVRRAMDTGRRHVLTPYYETAQAHLESAIAAATRRREKQASKKPFVINIVINVAATIRNWFGG